MSAPHELLARASAWLWPALANHLWQATLFAALVLCVTLLLRDGRARLRYALWLVAALKFAAPSALFGFLAARAGVGSPWGSAAETGAGAPLFLRITEPVAAESPDLVVVASGARSHDELFCALTVVWLAGCAALFAVWLGRRREFLRSVRGGAEARAGREFEALGRARARLGLRREVLLVLTDARTEPGVWRTRRPVLLLPSEVAGQLDDEELEAVLTHELAHVERRDNLWGNLQAALACVFWFNPAVWLVGGRLFAERESACDERVIEAGGRSGAYAAAILKVVRFCSGWRVAGVAGVASGSNLRRRIEMIMRGEKGGGFRAWHRAAVSGLAAAALALTVGAGLFGRDATTEARMLEGADDAPQDGARVVTRVARGGVERRGQEPGPAVSEVEQSPEASVFFELTAGAPVAITDARMRMITREQLRRAHAEGADHFDDDEGSQHFLTLPTVKVANMSPKAIRQVGVGFETGGKLGVIAGYAARMNPGESQTFISDWSRRNVILPGTFADVKVRVIWVAFEDGTQWGTRPGTPPPPPPPPPPHAPDAPDAPDVPEAPARGSGGSEAGGKGANGVAASVRVGSGSGGGASAARGGGVGEGVGGGAEAGRASGGGGSRLAGQKLYAPEPAYPAIAKAAGAEGPVGVRVTVDEEGDVVAAEAVSGHPLLHTAAVDAARQSRFRPTLVEGKPVKVSAVISYVFTLK
ncbi:MAG TPA: M56 family metallopeptidase [Pyrinomonadaceae bacterium]